jgi:hypothetical protein
MSPGVVVVVESIVFSTAGDGLEFRIFPREWDEGDTPDAAVITTLRGITDERWFAHSTSWRTSAPRSLVLTYAVVPPSDDDLGDLGVQGFTAPAALVRPGPGAAGSPLRPADAAPSAADVAWHAARHLSWLCRTDPAVVARVSSADSGSTWARLAELPVALAGSIDDGAWST